MCHCCQKQEYDAYVNYTHFYLKLPFVFKVINQLIVLCIKLFILKNMVNKEALAILRLFI
jgi:hypothetical protein